MNDKRGMGWIPDYPDIRDYTKETADVAKIFAGREGPARAGRRRGAGAGWGENGYGWLPYEYVLKGLADDFWSILKKEWLDTGEFAE